MTEKALNLEIKHIKEILVEIKTDIHNYAVKSENTRDKVIELSAKSETLEKDIDSLWKHQRTQKEDILKTVQDTLMPKIIKTLVILFAFISGLFTVLSLFIKGVL
jgi:hypothetical protein